MDKNSIWYNLPEALSNEEDLRLLREYRLYGSEEAKKKLFEGNLRLVRAHISRNLKWILHSQSQVYPDLEDLMQEGALVLMNAIEKFDLEYKFNFSTYLVNGLSKTLGNMANVKRYRKVRLARVTSSLNDLVNDEKGKTEHIDFLGDGNAFADKILDGIEIEDINKILAILPKRQRDVFLMYYKDEKSQQEIADRIGTVQMSVSRMLERTLKQIKDIYDFGFTELDIISKGVDLIPSQKKRVQENQLLIKKYGRPFLKNYFCAKLTPNQRAIFEEFYLKYYGQSQKEVGKRLGMSEKNVAVVLSGVKQYIEGNIDRLYEQYKSGEEVVPRKLPLKVQQKINRNKRLVEQYGGEMFLRKYFLSTLTEKEQKCFDLQVLSYAGESQDRIAKLVGVSSSSLQNITAKVLHKLEMTDFEVVVDMVDNANDKGYIASGLSLSSMEKVKKRLEIVEKYGGAEVLRKHFLPILPEQQKVVFENLYLLPTFSTYESMKKETGLRIPFIIKSEKVILEKLQRTNLDELQKISQMAEGEIAREFARQRAENMTQTVREKFATQKGNVVQENKFKDVFLRFGGVEFLRERFVPELMNADKIIFEEYMVNGKNVKQLNEILGINEHNYHYVGDKVKNRILPKFEELRAKYSDFEEEVKSFYMQKGFAKLHEEDFEALAFGFPTKEIEEEEESDVPQPEPILSEEQIEKWGGKRVIVRDFMPRFKTVKEQLFILNSIVKGLDEVETLKSLGVSGADFVALKNAVSKKLDDFSAERENKKSSSKSDKDKTQEKSKK